MRRLIVDQDDDFPQAVDRIIRVCAAAGFEIERNTAVLAWSIYSEEYYAASWMAADDLSDDYVLNAICLVTTVVEDE